MPARARATIPAPPLRPLPASNPTYEVVSSPPQTFRFFEIELIALVLRSRAYQRHVDNFLQPILESPALLDDDPVICHRRSPILCANLFILLAPLVYLPQRRERKHNWQRNMCPGGQNVVQPAAAHTHRYPHRAHLDFCVLVVTGFLHDCNRGLRFSLIDLVRVSTVGLVVGFPSESLQPRFFAIEVLTQ